MPWRRTKQGLPDKIHVSPCGTRRVLTSAVRGPACRCAGRSRQNRSGRRSHGATPWLTGLWPGCRFIEGGVMHSPYIYPQEFDVIVVGGGHAGTEAALAAARMGCKTLLLSHNIETLGQMSCNPSIGGIGKGHLVKEVDALGGAIAAATDEGGIQFRILNSSKGPAVRATRAQADRMLYKAAIRRRLENQPNLWLFQQAVDDLMVEGNRVVGAVTQVGIKFRSKTVVLTAGTFLDGKIHVGLNNYPAGRAGDPPAVSLSARLKELKLPQGRLKTGTPPRLDGRSIDFSKCTEQPGDGMV